MLPSRALSIACRLSLLSGRGAEGWLKLLPLGHEDPEIKPGCGGPATVPLPVQPGVMPLTGFGRKEAKATLLAPWGLGLLRCPGVTKSRPSPLGVRGDHTKPGPSIPPPACPCPFFLLSSPFLLFSASYPEVVSVISLPLLKTHEL